MASNVQDHVVDEVKIVPTKDERRKSTEHYVFHTIENIGKGGEDSDWGQRIGAMVIALLICTALYGLLYLAMYFQE